MKYEDEGRIEVIVNNTNLLKGWAEIVNDYLSPIKWSSLSWEEQKEKINAKDCSDCIFSPGELERKI